MSSSIELSKCTSMHLESDPTAEYVAVRCREGRSYALSSLWEHWLQTPKESPQPLQAKVPNFLQDKILVDELTAQLDHIVGDDRCSDRNHYKVEGGTNGHGASSGGVGYCPDLVVGVFVKVCGVLVS